MKTKTIKSSDFDFEGFIDTLVGFIEENFGSDSPDAAETMRYFYSFDQETGNDEASSTDKDPEDWKIDDFKSAIIQGGETIFFPFSSGLDLNGSVSLASDETVQLSEDDDEGEEDVPNIGITDCFGFLVNLTEDKFKFNSAIAWGIWFQVSSRHPTRESIKK